MRYKKKGPKHWILYLIVIIALLLVAILTYCYWHKEVNPKLIGYLLLEQFLTAIIIILAALIAQYIFNLNARKRENRERRLRALSTLMNQAHEFDDIYNLITKTNLNLQSPLKPLIRSTRHMEATAEIHNFKIMRTIKSLRFRLEYLTEEMGKEYDIRPNPLLMDHKEFEAEDRNLKLSILARSIESEIKDLVNKLKLQISHTFKDIEDNH